MNSMTHEAGWKDAFTEGLKSGIPIGLGYFPVSFTFGFLAVSGGLPVWVAWLMIMPILGWNLGTLFGGSISTLLPQALQNAMGIALYAMFIALIIPAARQSFAVLCVILAAVAIVCLLKYIPAFGFISSGFRVIAATIAASALGAVLFPKEEESDNGS